MLIHFQIYTIISLNKLKSVDVMAQHGDDTGLPKSQFSIQKRTQKHTVTSLISEAVAHASRRG